MLGSTFSAVKETSTQNSGVRVHVCNGRKVSWLIYYKIEPDVTYVHVIIF